MYRWVEKYTRNKITVLTGLIFIILLLLPQSTRAVVGIGIPPYVTPYMRTVLASDDAEAARLLLDIASVLHDSVTIGTANGLSLSTQELSLAAATNATPGAATAAHISAIEANTAKETNVSTALSTGTVNGTSYGITSDGGADDVILAQATTDNAGVLSADKWDEIVASTSHISATGASHTYINQDVTSGSTPTFTGTNFTGIDHGTGLTGLGDDDHTQYVLASGARTMTSLNVTNNITVGGTVDGVDIAGRDHNAVTLATSATTGGLSLSTQEIGFRAATNAQTGYATSAHISAIEANTAKITTQWTTTGNDIYYNTGKVGIGVTPTYDLDVAGSGQLRLDNTGTGDAYALFYSGGSLKWKIGNDYDQSHNFYLRGDGNTSDQFVTVTQAGEVGIGTTSPAANLEIEDGGTSNTVLLKVTADDGNPYSLVVGNDTFSTTDADGLALWVNNAGKSRVGALGTGAELAFRTVGTDRMTIDSSGKVGIGTSSPTNQVEVEFATSSIYGLSVWNQSSEGHGLLVKTNSDTASDPVLWVGRNGQNPSIYVGGGASGGNVGIGTTSPVAGIDLKTTSSTVAGGDLKITEGSVSTTRLALQSYATDNTTINFDCYLNDALTAWKSSDAGSNFQLKKTGDKFYLNYDSGVAVDGDITFNNGFVMDSSGKVGIGTSSPGDYLAGRNNLVIADTSSQAGLTIASSTSDEGIIAFADGTTGDARYRGQIVYAHSSNSLGLWTAAAERVHIDSTGKVGIGTSSPGTILSFDENTDTIIGVNRCLSSGSGGDLQLRAGAGSGAGNSGGNLYLASGTGASSATVGQIQFGRSNGDDTTMPPDNIWMTIGNSGSVGIGTTSPGSLFEIESAQPRFTISESGVTADNGKWLIMGHDENLYFQTENDAQNSAITWLKIQRTGTTVTDVLFPEGNFGIGTDDPDNLLEIETTEGTNYDGTQTSGQRDQGSSLIISNLDSGADSYAQIVLKNAGSGGTSYGRIVGIGDGTESTDIAFVAESAGSIAERMRITAAGKVGIGTSNIDELLHIESTGKGGAILKIESTAVNGYPGIRFKNDVQDWRIYGADGEKSDSFTIYDGTAGAYRFVIDTSGNVGIGTTSPGATFEVKGVTSNWSDQVVVQEKSNSTAKLHIGQFSDGTLIFNNYMYRAGHTTDNASLASSGISLSGGTITFERAPASATPTRVTSMKIDASGNVGLGTTSPDTLLHTKVVGTNTLTMEGNNATGDGVANQIYFKDTSAASGSYLKYYDWSASGGGARFSFETAGSSALFTILNGGNVGLGVSSFGTSAAKVLGIGDGTAPTSNPASMVQLYSLSGELWVEDSGGTATQLSANTDDFPEDMAFDPNFPYVTVKQNAYAGVRTYVSEHRMAQLVQELSRQAGLLGEDEFIIKHVAMDPCDTRNWDDNETWRKTLQDAKIDDWEYAKGLLLAEATEYERIRDALIVDPNTVLDPNEYRSLDPEEVVKWQFADANDITKLSELAADKIDAAMKMKKPKTYKRKAKKPWFKKKEGVSL